jgi:Flp pilus assembly pilin Flp
MKNIKIFARKLWKDESGQGATEYILLLVVVVALALLFRTRIEEMVRGRLDAIGGALSGFNP